MATQVVYLRGSSSGKAKRIGDVGKYHSEKSALKNGCPSGEILCDEREIRGKSGEIRLENGKSDSWGFSGSCENWVNVGKEIRAMDPIIILKAHMDYSGTRDGPAHAGTRFGHLEAFPPPSRTLPRGRVF